MHICLGRFEGKNTANLVPRAFPLKVGKALGTQPVVRNRKRAGFSKSNTRFFSYYICILTSLLARETENSPRIKEKAEGP